MHRLLTIILTVVCLSGCNSDYFKNPVGSPEQEMELDLRLAGHWVLDPAASGQDLGKYGFVQFLWDGSLRGFYQVTAYTIDGDNRTGETSLVFATEIDGVGYLNTVHYSDLIGASPNEEGDVEPEWHLARYELIGSNELRIYEVDDRVIMRAVRKGTLAGEIVEDKYYHVTADSEALADFVRSHDIFDYSSVIVYRYRDIGMPVP